MKTLFALCLLCLSSLAQAAGDPTYVHELQQRAAAQHLAQTAPWQRLLHVTPGYLGIGARSTIDDPLFFRAPNGAEDADAELMATLAFFFTDTPIADEPPQCRYKARYEWLRERLQFDPARLPPQPCTELDQWLQGLNVGAASLVFASNDLNSPSSMFGHTLLRLDARSQDPRDRLLAYAVNYAADTGDVGEIAYAVRGITGNFRGAFSVYPYYEKIKEYAHVEHRDLWEYPLNLTPKELLRLQWHLWELRGIGSDYFFFSENCSFQLLALIEAARPALDLTAPFKHSAMPRTIPLDSVRALRAAGVIGTPRYYAANAKRLRVQLQTLSATQIDWAQDYVAHHTDFDDTRLTTASPQQRARMLEVAHRLLYFQLQSGQQTREQAASALRESLAQRAQIDADTQWPEPLRPVTDPDRGHASNRVSVGARVESGTSALQLQIRPSYHDRLDPPGGYLASGELELLNLSVLASRDRLQIDQFKLVNVQAIAARDEAFQPWSWQVSGGARHVDLEQMRARPSRTLGGYLDGGAGMAWGLGAHAQLYGFWYSALDVNADAPKGWLLRSGARSGIAYQPLLHWTMQLEADVLGGLSPDARHYTELRAGTQVQFLPQQGLRLQWTRGQRGSQVVQSTTLLWQWYY